MLRRDCLNITLVMLHMQVRSRSGCPVTLDPAWWCCHGCNEVCHLTVCAACDDLISTQQSSVLQCLLS